MAIFAEHREVRVTARKSVKAPFTAPELSAPRTVDIELDKGLKGWTDTDVKIEEPGDGNPVGLAARRLEEITAGKVASKARPARQGRVVSTTGPNAHYRAMKARAAALAAR
ncbi:hypothetical protein FGG36_gp10 [Mycobacterium phage Jeffabunny]|uniref:Uncharacterized protein n=4 Tax=Gladiatorvirus TaxID=2948726 RepID=V5R6X2_9CAUD|nr:hypothetical protein X820_gp009 [Mycobacterium phage CloudWang3]YP_008858529.1 hypothetical protein X828_gp009 [Mycobacterium phage Artemis2UCLA]YP_008859211.1 hypothetical protein X821_gp009 [Mycobacterium phage Zaka]YP_009224225.1 hypothetical protein AXJ19_gp009 [Mycobacterium phage VohminGhazi]YP_009638265.1 hypothetical protein FGG36_gp10 [Mycobacterium phage Jeffabunny]AEK08543.1 hypothetical protein PBI_DAVINCI_100 [Mycobacterium phage DaVinci]AMQ66936.1 hypothetical protein PBI_MCF